MMQKLAQWFLGREPHFSICWSNAAVCQDCFKTSFYRSSRRESAHFYQVLHEIGADSRPLLQVLRCYLPAAAVMKGFASLPQSAGQSQLD
jgi:hypothetical protein